MGQIQSENEDASEQVKWDINASSVNKKEEILKNKTKYT